MTKSIKGVTRVDYEGIVTKGWMVRITRNGERKQQFFNDKSYGGKAKSLKAAKECYDEWVASAPPISTSRNVKTKRNSTGKVGVHVAHNVDSRWENAESFAYCASWIIEGRREKVSFAWKRFGKKIAWELACLARDQLVPDRKKVIALWEKKSGKKLKVKSS